MIVILTVMDFSLRSHEVKQTNKKTNFLYLQFVPIQNKAKKSLQDSHFIILIHAVNEQFIASFKEF